MEYNKDGRFASFTRDDIGINYDDALFSSAIRIG